jgi:predicted aminopeptidase
MPGWAVRRNNIIAIAAGWCHCLAIRALCGCRLVGDVNDECKFDMADFAIMDENYIIDCDVEPLDEACEPK